MVKRFTKSISLLLAACCMVSIVGGCSSSNQAAASGTASSAASEAAKDEKVTLKVYMQYSADDEKQPYDYAVEQMKKVMPNVTLDLEIMAQDDNQKLKTYAATNNLPDIFVATTDIIEAFKKSNNILQLDPYISELGIADKLLPSAQPLLKSGDGHTWAIPDAGQFGALLYYNKSVFKKCGVEVPQNYDQFLDAVKKIKAKNIVPLALFGKEKWVGVQLFDMLATREEPKGIKGLDTGDTKITDKAYTNAANKLVELVKNGLLPADVFNVSADDANAMLKSGKAAMYLSGAWSLSDFGQSMGDNVGYMFAPLASADTASSVQWNISGGGYNSGLGVSANSAYKDIAAKYACQFAMYFAKGRIIKRGDPNPILKETVEPEKAYSAVQKQYVADSANFKSTTCFDWGLTNSTFKANIEDGISKLLTGDYSVSQFQQDIQNSAG